MISQFNFPTTIRFGAGVVKELGDYLKKNNWVRPLIVTDPTVRELPFFKGIVTDLQNAGSSMQASKSSRSRLATWQCLVAGCPGNALPGAAPGSGGGNQCE